MLLVSVIAHEYAHGYAALKQGDTTALKAGRLTWNPIKHIDLWMTILLPVLLYWVSRGAVVLGGAKPVPVDPRNYRNYRRGDIIVSLAGVVTNLLIAVICTAVIALRRGSVPEVIEDGVTGFICDDVNEMVQATERIAEIDPEFREVLILRDVEDMSYEEIAEITGLADGTVKSRIHRARLQLKQAVELALGEKIG